VEVAVMDRGLPHSAFAVLRSLTRFGPLAPKEISEKSKVPERTVTYALRRLMQQKLLIKIPNLEDMRQCLYTPNLETVQELLRIHGHDSLMGTQLSLILRR
jgi:DNA-binding MarR family transcriptional regulator